MSHWSIAHEIPGRIRLRVRRGLAATAAAQAMARAAARVPGVLGLAYSPRTGSLLFLYQDPAARQGLLALVLAWDPAAAPFPPAGGKLPARAEPAGPPATLGRTLAPWAGMLLLRMALPQVFRPFFLARRVFPFLFRGGRALLRGRFGVEVLDGLAIGVSLLRRDYRTAAGVALLLGLGEMLEGFTRRTSRESLAQSLAATFDTAWVRRRGHVLRIPAVELSPGDLVEVGLGRAIPVDGVVESGEAMVNQAAMTGEALAVHKRPGAPVFAGTVVEEGEILVRAASAGDQTRIHKMVQVIEESADFKSRLQGQAERLADRLVPWTILASLAVYLATRDARRAAAVLLVDYSCAIKLATPLAVLSAMRDAARRGMLVKGGRFLEELARADAFVFDKTGTLTAARPRVAEVVPFGRRRAGSVLRLAACLEEHFPHPVARAVVRKAEEEGLDHREAHAQVEYILAHGLASRVRGERVVIGSRHFVHEDEGVDLAEADALLAGRPDLDASALYLAVGGELAGLLLIEDEMLPEAEAMVRELRADGIEHLAMLTGDAPRAAAKVASRLGLDEVHSQLLPEDKAAVVRSLRESGRVVAMVGDGVNDAAALSMAQVGISPRHGTDLARQAADILLAPGELGSLPELRRISRQCMRRIRTNFSVIVGFNSAVLLAGLLGLLPPGLSALSHNLATVGVALGSIRPYRLPALPPATPERGESHDRKPDSRTHPLPPSRPARQRRRRRVGDAAA